MDKGRAAQAFYRISCFGVEYVVISLSIFDKKSFVVTGAHHRQVFHFNVSQDMIPARTSDADLPRVAAFFA